jgi:hypothetical protein
MNEWVVVCGVPESSVPHPFAFFAKRVGNHEA